MTPLQVVIFGMMPGLLLIIPLLGRIDEEKSAFRWVWLNIMTAFSFGGMMSVLPVLTGQLDIYLTSLLITYAILNLAFWFRRARPPTVNILLA